MDRLTSAGNIVLATMRSFEYEKFLPQGEIKHDRWDVLQKFEKVWLAEDESERARFAAAIGDTRVRQGIVRYGLGQYIGGADVALGRFQAGEATHKLGVAMLRAACDWQRIGRGDIPADLLGRLARGYLRRAPGMIRARTRRPRCPGPSNGPRRSGYWSRPPPATG